jgi:acetolactate synthase-1/2/3 large subunit
VLLIGGCAPVPQDDLGPLQGIDHVAVMRPVTRSARTLRVAGNLLRDLDKAVSTALGDGNPPGSVYLEIPTDVLRQTVPPAVALPEYLTARQVHRIPPDPAQVEQAAAMIARSRRPLVLTGRGAQGAAAELGALLIPQARSAPDTQESSSRRAGTRIGGGSGSCARDAEADLAIVIDRLSYQTGYGCRPWPMPVSAHIGDSAENLREQT